MTFRLLAASALVASALLAACGSGTSSSNDVTPGGTSGSSGAVGSSGAAAATCTPVDAAQCSPARGISTVEAFLAEQKQLPWQPIASSRNGTLSVSADLVAEADLVIEASTLSLPPSCATNADAGPLPSGCTTAVFREDAFPRSNDTARVPGVSCAVPRQEVRRGWGQLCSTLTIARGTVFRMRNVVLDDHPSRELQSVEIVPSCAVPCASGEARCAATQTCFPLGHDTCAYCDGKSVATCACTDACSARADGASCSYDTSPDTPVSGTCSSGKCSSAR